MFIEGCNKVFQLRPIVKNMWIYGIVVLCFLGFTDTTQHFIIECADGCRIRNNFVIEGIAGNKIKLRFTFSDNNDTKFADLELKFNSRNLLKAYRYGRVIKVDKYDPRFIIPEKLISKEGKEFMFEFTFRNLSIAEDNGKEFNYVIDCMRGPDKEVRGSKVLNVLVSQWYHRTSHKYATSSLTSRILIGFILLIVIVILLLSYYMM